MLQPGYGCAPYVMLPCACILLLHAELTHRQIRKQRLNLPSEWRQFQEFLSNTSGMISVLSSDSFSNLCASIVFDANSPLIMATTFSSFTSFISESGIQY